jgi:Protein of unknown function (DUF3179)
MRLQLQPRFSDTVLHFDLVGQAVLSPAFRNRRTMIVRAFSLYGRAKLGFGNTNGLMTDAETSSVWNFSGCAVRGPLTGQCLQPVDAVKDYWFDWVNYHPGLRFFGASGLRQAECGLSRVRKRWLKPAAT